MYRYADERGNEFVLEVELESKLLSAALVPSNQVFEGVRRHEKFLSSQEYMQLVLAFSLAIDNKICQCELRNQRTGMITVVEDGQERRYFLVAKSLEREELEGLLCGCFQLG